MSLAGIFRRESKCYGFTLIELLIVVAIIGILAAIAIPNFLEAQVRAKVSRCVADMRTLATGLEIYHVDQDNYPVAVNAVQASGHGISERLIPLTSPIEYLSSLPEDPFVPTNTWVVGLIIDTFDYFDATSNRYDLSLFGSKWRLCSAGPDRIQHWGVEGNWPYSGPLVYDSSNGTISDGDVITLQGGRNPYEGWMKLP